MKILNSKTVLIGMMVGSLFLTVTSTGASATSVSTRARSQAQSPHLPRTALRLPLMRQAETWSCGASALQSVFAYWGVFFGTEAELREQLKTTPEDGTHPKMIEHVSRAAGLHTEFRTQLNLNDLKTGLQQGKTIILDIQAWSEGESLKLPWSERWEDGHYVVLSAIDRKNIYVMDPSSVGNYGYIPIDEFMDRWHDYEVENGKKVPYVQSAIFIHGTTPNFPIKSGLVRVE